VNSVADGIVEGALPPDLTSMYRDKIKIEAALQRKGFNLSLATSDWKAIQKHLSTLNGAQQERLRQAISFTGDSLDQIDSLYKEWKQVAGNSQFRILNKANLKIAKERGGRAGEVATNLEAQINDLISELGTVYKGGNASTDESLRLAAENLKADWNEQTFNRAIQQIHTNLKIRTNSIVNSQPAGLNNPNTPYVTPTNAAPVIPPNPYRK
jgi:hypothetical protein